MPLWGKAAAGTQTQKPKWLSTDENSKYKKQDCIGMPGGWAQRAGSSATGCATSVPEVLAAMKGNFGTTLAAPSITSARFITTSHTNGGSKTITVEVTWDERVTVATANPTLVIANGNQSGDGDGNATLTYTATGSTTNRKRFTNASLTLSTSDVYTLGGGSQADIVLASSSTISDTTVGGTTTAALLVLTALAAQTITVTAS